MKKTNRLKVIKSRKVYNYYVRTISDENKDIRKDKTFYRTRKLILPTSL